MVKSTCSETSPVLLLVHGAFYAHSHVGSRSWFGARYVALESRCFCANYLLRSGNRIRGPCTPYRCSMRHTFPISGILSPRFARLFSDPLLLRLELST
jgi:hypothetical protein